MKNLAGEMKICAAVLGALFTVPAAADNSGIKFSGGIGVIPISSAANCPAVNPCLTGPPVTLNRNIVRGVSPAGQIWVINKLDANVSANGSITVNGQGLVLGGGDTAGRAPAATSVLATLICQPAAPFTQSSTSTAGVALSATGDFQINDMLSPVPPNPCVSPMLLIRNAANLGWFAVGIFGPGHDD